MYDEKLEATTERCMTVVRTLPKSERDRLTALLEETRKRHAEIKRQTKLAHDALDDWRLLHKYQLFDLEARLREA